jgi:preprotein translocase subunit SecB
MTNADEAIQKDGTLERFPISVTNVYLVHCHFIDRDSPESDPSPVVMDEVPFSIKFAFVRPSLRKLVMAMICQIETEKPYALEVMYAGAFLMEESFPIDSIETTWKSFAAEVAPVILYPYVREFVSDLTTRGRAASLTLPVLYVGLGLDPDTLILPQPEEYPVKQKQRRKKSH